MSTQVHYVEKQSTHPIDYIVLSKKHSEWIVGQTQGRLCMSDVPQFPNLLLRVGVSDPRCRSWRRYGLHSDVESECRPIVSNGIRVYLDIASKKITNFSAHT